MLRDAFDWSGECAYISRAADVKGNLPEFNHSTPCFLRYCVIQRDTAERQGFWDSAEHIQHVIDDLSE